jgi:ribosome maturation factor RimP
MIRRNDKKDLDDWIGKPVKVLLNAEAFYEGILLAEQRNGILIESANKRIYIQFDSIISLEEEV